MTRIPLSYKKRWAEFTNDLFDVYRQRAISNRELPNLLYDIEYHPMFAVEGLNKYIKEYAVPPNINVNISDVYPRRTYKRRGRSAIRNINKVRHRSLSPRHRLLKTPKGSPKRSSRGSPRGSSTGSSRGSPRVIESRFPAEFYNSSSD